MVTERHTITEVLAPQTRIYDYLPGKLETLPSRKGIKKALSKGYVVLNNQTAFSGDYVKKGDEIMLVSPEKQPFKLFPLKVDVVYEDEYIAVVHKPAGLITSGNYYKTLHNCLPYNLTLSNQKDKLVSPLPVHRLDRATSGLVIVAKTYKARMVLGEAFEHKTVKKSYYAIVQGYLKAHGVLNQPISGKEAITYFKTIASVPCKRNSSLTLVELQPHTGRTHQLRIHLATIGYPIYGDQLHGDPNNTKKNKGLFLFAFKLAFYHPITNTPLTFELTKPKKFDKYFPNIND